MRWQFAALLLALLLTLFLAGCGGGSLCCAPTNSGSTDVTVRSAHVPTADETAKPAPAPTGGQQ